MRKLIASIVLSFLVTIPAFAQWYTKPPPGTQINWGHPLSRGLVGAWFFNEGAGSQVWDYSGNGNHGEKNGATWGGGAMNFDTTGYVKAPDVNDLLITNHFTWIVCFKQSGSQDAFAVPMFKSGAGGVPTQDGGFFFNNSITDLNARLRFVSSGLVDLSVTGLTAGQKHQLAMTYNKNEFILSADGLQADSLSISEDVVANSGRKLEFGDISNPFENSFSGQILYALIYNRALSEDEVMAIYINPYSIIQQKQAWLYFLQQLKIPIFYHHYKQMGN